MEESHLQYEIPKQIKEIHAKESQRETEVKREWILSIDQMTMIMIGIVRVIITTEDLKTGRIINRDIDLLLIIGRLIINCCMVEKLHDCAQLFNIN